MMNIEELSSLPPVSQMMTNAGLTPKKSLGQNFLFDLNLTGKIARSVPDIENSTVIEVGPGPGGLTRALLMAGAKKVIAIEKDKTTEPILEKIAAASGVRMDIVFADAMKIDYTEFGEFRICANLPYNVGTQLLIKWLHMPNIKSMTLMFQREVAERVVARVGDKHYGRLAVLTALNADAKILFNVPNTAFVPSPRVQSAVVQIIPKPSSGLQLQRIEALTAKLFGQRRKMIRGIMPDVDWAHFGLTGTERAEELSPQKFAELALGIISA